MAHAYLLGDNQHEGSFMKELAQVETVLKTRGTTTLIQHEDALQLPAASTLGKQLLRGRASLKPALARVGLLLGKQHEVLVFNSHGIIVQEKKEKLRNAKTERKVQHGERNPTTPNMLPPDAEGRGDWQSALTLQAQLLILAPDFAADLARFTALPSVLFLALSCYGGWEPSLAIAVLQRGCQHYIGFRTMSASHEVSSRQLIEKWVEGGSRADGVKDAFVWWAKRFPESFPVLYTMVGGKVTATLPATKSGNLEGRTACAKVLAGVDVDFIQVPTKDIYERAGAAKDK